MSEIPDEAVEAACRAFNDYRDGPIHEQRTHLRKVLAAALPYLRPQWIACSERMPTHNGLVIIYNEGAVEAGGHIRGDKWCGMDGHYCYGVTHWQEMPDAPGEGA